MGERDLGVRSARDGVRTGDGRSRSYRGVKTETQRNTNTPTAEYVRVGRKRGSQKASIYRKKQTGKQEPWKMQMGVFHIES